MLGSFRFFLAICVVLFHLTAQIPNLGQFAVECFYVISGYLVTMILTKTYKFEFKSFALNRFLRLYPSYYALALLTLAMWFILPRMDEFHACWVWAGRATDVIGNLLIWPWTFFPDQPGNYKFRLIPSTWSIAVEICCYALLWAFAARSWKWTVATLVASASYHAYSLYSGMDPSTRYSPVSAAMLAFATGSLAYRASSFVVRHRPAWMGATAAQPFLLLLAVGAFLAVWKASTYDGTATSNPFYYGVIIVAAAAALMFHGIRATGVLGWVDRWLGDLSYPVFLIHYPAGYLVWLALGQPEAMRSWSIALWAIPVSVAISAITILAVDIPLRRTRDRIRAGAPGVSPIPGSPIAPSAVADSR
ncbi:acyltransferase [Stenotrophomonas sp. 278]|uniref:acyltransferase family protein n=1 Tax=Stenotrophomonas sp. 278 TaxID=2479851 RepID=UPI000F68637D|nr:acyltransferase [Stenotrophomonas sp. 278]RRU23564.1 acyltransferase [Stenotrophomonas sp. 278]